MTQSQIQELGRLRPQLVNFAMLRLRNAAQAEDAVQDTLVAAIEAFDKFAGGSSLRTWLTGILKHKIVDCLRGSSREEPLEVDENELLAHEQGPDEELARRRIFETVANSLKRLPVKAMRVFELREVWGANTAEVCGELGITPSHSWVLLHRARARLRQCPDIRRVAFEAGAL